MATVTAVVVRNLKKNGVGIAFSPKLVWENAPSIPCANR